MAKRIIDEEMRFRIIINGNEAQKELFDLEKSTKSLVATNNKLRTQRQRLERQGKKNGAEWKKLTAQITANTATIQKNHREMDRLEKEIGVTGLSMAQLYKKASQLRSALRVMIPGSADAKAYEIQLKQVNARLDELRMKSRGAKSGISKLADGFNRYAAIGASVIAALTGVVFSIQRMIDYNGKLSDSISDVRKTTGLTETQVKDLAKSFGLFKTRTTRIELLKLAEEAGRLGIEGTANIAAFVKEANKIKVALGDDLSDEAIREIGKIVNIYKVGEATGKDFAGSMDALGSAINEVSASGSSNAGFLVDYLKRMAGVAAQAKISGADNIGYAATFDELGQSVEISATAMNKVFLDMFKNPKEYAKIAGLSIKEFNTLLETDSNKAMITFLKGLNGTNGGLGIMSKKLDKLGIDGARSSQALLALAGNTKLLEKRQILANIAQEDAISLTEEYNLKNNNLAGIIDKVKKKFIGFFSSDTIVSGMTGFISWFAKFIGATEDATGGTTRFRNALVFFLKILAVVTAALITNVAWLKLLTIWEGRNTTGTILNTAAKKANAIASEIAFAAGQIYAAGTMLLTGNIKGATQAIRVLSTTMKTTPWGLAIGLIAAVVTAYIAFSKEAKIAATKQSMLADAMQKSGEETAGISSKIDALREVVEDETASEEARMKAMVRLNNIVPDYNENLDLSSKALEKGRKKLDSYVEGLQKQAEAQYLADQVVLKSEEIKKKEGTTIESHIQWYEQLWNVVKTGGNAIAYNNAQLKTGLQNRKESIELSKEELKVAKEALKEYIKLNPNTTKTIDDFTPTPTGNDTGDGDVNNSTRSRKLFNLERERELVEKIKKENALALATLEDNEFKRELQQLQVNHEEKVRQLKLQEMDLEELKNLQNKYEEARQSGNDEEAKNLQEYMGIRFEKNMEITNKLATLELTHQQEKGKIIAEGFSNRLAEQQENFERERIAREENQNNQLAALGDKEEAKKALQEKFNQKNLQIELKHLEDVQAQAQEIFNNGQFEGLNLDLITDEQKQAIIDRLSEIGLSISEINLLLNQLQNGGSQNNGALGLEGLGAGNQTDLFGFTIDQWQSMYDNFDTAKGKLQAITGVVQGLHQAWAMYNEYRNASDQKSYREFEERNSKQKIKLKDRLDSGLINQRQYDAAVSALEKESDKRKADLEYRAAKRKYELDLTQAIVTGSMAILNGFNTQPFLPLGLAMGALATVMTGLQIATITKNKPVRGFQDGLYPIEREQDGKIFNARNGGFSRSGIVSEPTLFLAGEEGRLRPEMIINGTDYNNFTPEFKGSLNRELARVKGYQDGFYQSSTSTAQSSQELYADNENITTTDQAMLMSVIGRNTEVMQYLIDNGVIAYMSRDMENTQKLKEDLDRLQKYKDKARINGS